MKLSLAQKFTSIIPFLLVVITFEVNAKQLVTLCNNCNETTMANQAIKVATNGGIVHVVDMSGNKIKAFEIEREGNLLWYSESIVSKAIQNGVNEIKEVNNFIEDMSRLSINANSLTQYTPRPINSAYDVAISKANRVYLAEAISKYFLSNVGGALTSAVGSLGVNFVGQIVPITITLPVVFNDGTTYQFAFKGLIINVNGGEITLNIEAIEFSGVDGELRIPEAMYISGYYGKGSTQSVQRMIDYLSLSGVQILVNPVDRSSVTIIDCTKDSTSGGACKAIK
ncbi:MAG: hypothetical protein AAGJ17_02470 [Pseudomonadota bacterium]